MRFLPVFAALLGLLVLTAAAPVRVDAKAGGIKVVASIAPVHSLLAGVMKGVGGVEAGPGLLVTGGSSPHDYVMKPSKARMLHRADVVFWIGPGLEGFLKKPLAGLQPGTRVITLVPEQDDDPHIWLDPQGAAKMVRTMVRVLSEADRDNAARYRANGDKVRAGLIALDREILQILKPVAVVPYLVFHDAYRYFEKRFGLASQGAVSVQVGRPPGARRGALAAAAGVLRDKAVGVGRHQAAAVVEKLEIIDEHSSQGGWIALFEEEGEEARVRSPHFVFQS